jgi:hypothetical protein
MEEIGKADVTGPIYLERTRTCMQSAAAALSLTRAESVLARPLINSLLLFEGSNEPASSFHSTNFVLSALRKSRLAAGGWADGRERHTHEHRLGHHQRQLAHLCMRKSSVCMCVRVCQSLRYEMSSSIHKFH